MHLRISSMLSVKMYNGRRAEGSRWLACRIAAMAALNSARLLVCTGPASGPASLHSGLCGKIEAQPARQPERPLPMALPSQKATSVEGCWGSGSEGWWLGSRLDGPGSAEA